MATQASQRKPTDRGSKSGGSSGEPGNCALSNLNSTSGLCPRKAHHRHTARHAGFHGDSHRQAASAAAVAASEPRYRPSHPSVVRPFSHPQPPLGVKWGSAPARSAASAPGRQTDSRNFGCSGSISRELSRCTSVHICTSPQSPHNSQPPMCPPALPRTLGRPTACGCRSSSCGTVKT